MSGDWILTKKFLNGSDHIHRLAPSADVNAWAATSVFIEDIQEFQEFQPTIIHCLIKLKVSRPNVMWVLGSQPLVGAVCRSGKPRVARDGALKPFHPPNPPHPLVIDRPAFQVS